jgi:hypothetical protein
MTQNRIPQWRCSILVVRLCYHSWLAVGIAILCWLIVFEEFYIRIYTKVMVVSFVMLFFFLRMKSDANISARIRMTVIRCEVSGLKTAFS